MENWEADKIVDSDVTVEESMSEEYGIESTYQEKHPLLRGIISLVTCVAIAVGLSFVITKFVAVHTSVEGRSMESSLQNADRLIVEKMSYYFREPERFEIVVFPYNEEVNYIKRVIGLPGETIQIKDGAVYINGAKLDDPYAKVAMEDAGIAAEPLTLGEDEYFVLGDNRNASSDSRKRDVGVIKKERITGRAWLRIYPFDRFSLISSMK